MTNTTDFESVHPRADSGAFTDKLQNAPEQPPLSEDAARARADHAQSALEKIHDRYRAIQKEMHLANAKVIAAVVLAEHPDAKYLELEWSDQEGDSWYSTGVTGPDGEELDFDTDELDGYASDLPLQVPDVFSETDSGFVRSDETGYEWLITDDRARTPKVDLQLAIKIGE